MSGPALTIPERPQLAQNIAHFGRALRRAGVHVGTGQILRAVRAVEIAGIASRDEFFWVLRACFISRPEDRATFAQCFRLFWRDPRYLEQMMSMLLPSVRGAQPEPRPNPAERRAAEGLTDRPPPQRPVPQEAEVTINAARTASDQERLRQLDFEQMSAEDMVKARRMIAQLRLPAPDLITRRFDARPGARPDPRRALRQMARQGGELGALPTRRRRMRAPDLVVLCDISGSMAAYSRAVLQFAHGVMTTRGAGWGRISAFTFGTRLTNITRHLATRDVDAALAAAGAEARDWEGGTRIGQSLDRFNRDWSRRVLGTGAVVLLITDGLERDIGSPLAGAAERLALSCRQLVWVNPLLRYDGYAPRAAGVRALLPHVHTVVPGHNIASLAGLAQALTDARGGRRDGLLAQLRTQA